MKILLKIDNLQLCTSLIKMRAVLQIAFNKASLSLLTAFHALFYHTRSNKGSGQTKQVGSHQGQVASFFPSGYSIFIVVGEFQECEADQLLKLMPAVQRVKPKLLTETASTSTASKSDPGNSKLGLNNSKDGG